jgi:hypothetical protein
MADQGAVVVRTALMLCGVTLCTIRFCCASLGVHGRALSVRMHACVTGTYCFVVSAVTLGRRHLLVCLRLVCIKARLHQEQLKNCVSFGSESCVCVCVCVRVRVRARARMQGVH